jgi:hypothetical protein
MSQSYLVAMFFDGAAVRTLTGGGGVNRQAVVGDLRES